MYLRVYKSHKPIEVLCSDIFLKSGITAETNNAIALHSVADVK